MPILVLLIIGISIYSLTIKHTGDDGTIRTGFDGLKVYLIPDFKGMTFRDIFMVVMDAMGQLFFSISVAMGIMVAYGSYVKKDVNLMKSINQIEIFDTAVAFLAGLMIVPAVYVFSGMEGMSAGLDLCSYLCQRYSMPWVRSEQSSEPCSSSWLHLRQSHPQYRSWKR